MPWNRREVGQTNTIGILRAVQMYHITTNALIKRQWNEIQQYMWWVYRAIKSRYWTSLLGSFVQRSSMISFVQLQKCDIFHKVRYDSLLLWYQILIIHRYCIIFLAAFLIAMRWLYDIVWQWILILSVNLKSFIVSKLLRKYIKDIMWEVRFRKDYYVFHPL